VVEIKDLEPGMVVKIVDNWAPSEQWAEPYGKMDKWLGTNMTIRYVDFDCVKMEEDREEYNGDGWCWVPSMLDYVVEPIIDIHFDEADFLSMLGEG